MGITLDPAVLQRLSLPVHDVHEERDVFVTMRDGVRVAIDVFRPRAEGAIPRSCRSRDTARTCKRDSSGRSR